MLKDDSVCLEKKIKERGRGSEPAEGKEEMQTERVQTEDPYFSIARNAAGSTSGMWISSLFSASSP